MGQDGTQRNFPERLTRVSARSPVSEHGIHPESPSPLLDPVKRDTIIVPKSTRRSTVSAPDTTLLMANLSKTTVQLLSTSLTNPSIQSVVSFTTVSSIATLSLSRVESWAQRSERSL